MKADFGGDGNDCQEGDEDDADGGTGWESTVSGSPGLLSDFTIIPNINKNNNKKKNLILNHHLYHQLLHNNSISRNPSTNPQILK